MGRPRFAGRWRLRNDGGRRTTDPDPSRLPQQKIISKIRRLAEVDEQFVAAMLYGSFATGGSDRFSDVDCILFLHDEVLSAAFDRQEWVNQVAPVALFYRNEFGNYVTIFANLVRAEFHFYPAGEMAAKINSWQGEVYFPTLETTILVDKTGELAQHLASLIGLPPGRDTPQDAQFLVNSFLNWILFGTNVLARGELARAAEILFLVQDNLLRMVRLQEGTAHHWITPTRAAEQELSTTAYARFVTCTAATDQAALWRAYLVAWDWGQSLLATLVERHGLDRPVALISAMDRYFHSLKNSSP